MRPANYSPIYCALYPQIAEIARKHGYAACVHGSLARDMDVVCVPWVEKPSSPEEVVIELVGKFYMKKVGDGDVTHHGRIRFTLAIGFGECFVDLSFMPGKNIESQRGIFFLKRAAERFRRAKTP